MHISLQRRLTLSHLAVTAVSVTVLVILILIGYFVYLRSDLAAAWAGDMAENYAIDLSYWVEDDGGTLNSSLAQEYIDTAAYDLGSAFDDNAEQVEWLFVLTPDGRVLASNFVDPPSDGTALSGFNPNADPAKIHYDTIAGTSIGQTAVFAGDGVIVGWIYYRFPNDADFLLKDTAFNVVLAAGGAALIAIVVSGIVGGWLARYFARRLNALNDASAAFAAGDFDQRVTLDGNDEIAQLGAQFNQMADQIGRQMEELRQLAEKNAQLAEEARALAALEERNRLARELHDAIKQQLFGLGLTVGAAQQLLQKDPEQAAARLTQMTGMVKQIQEEMDGIIKQLRPSSLGDEGLAVAVRDLCDGWGEQTAVSITTTIKHARPLPLNIEHALYRVTQEGLNNIARHARASQVTVGLVYGKTAVFLHIADNGIGFAVGEQSSSSFGLVNMKHRIETLGGELKIESGEGMGTAVTVRIPTKT